MNRHDDDDLDLLGQLAAALMLGLLCLCVTTLVVWAGWL